jgi:succinate-semialdehyde dehydrogenase/glutarate-semialdehyde dehydrogenase
MHEQAAKYPVFINGEWYDSGTYKTVHNPADDSEIAHVSCVDRLAVANALAAAEAALPLWNRKTAKERGEHLRALADEIHRRTDVFARLITMENGKPLAQSLGEVAMSIDHILWFAEEGRRAYGRVIPHQAEGKRHLVIRQPVGVVGAIAPWNFPLVLAVRKAAPALAAGCPVILKPASATPLSSLELARCVEAVGLPSGAFQLVFGSAPEIASEFLSNPICRKISFTGSTEVGRSLIKGAAANCTKLSLELGGNAPLIIFADADLDSAVEGALITKFRNSGQSCIAANRIYVQQSIYDSFVEQLAARVRSLKVGDGLTEGVDIGPMINRQAMDSAMRIIEQAVSEGANLLVGGKRLGDRGNFIEPALLADVEHHASCMRQEIFAPVAVVCPFSSEQEAISHANNTPFGLAAYVYTQDLNRAFRLSEKLEAGTIGINDPVPSTSNCPFGGLKQSGWGRELGSEGLDSYLETKHVSIARIS